MVLRRHEFDIQWCSMQRNIRNLLIAQIILIFLVATGFFIAVGIIQALAAIYGGSLLLINTGIMILKLKKSESADTPGFQLAIYSGFIQRLLIAIVGFIIGIAWLQLPPGPQVVAFGVSYLSFVIAAKYQYP